MTRVREQAFNSRIKKFLREQPESNASKKILEIEKFDPQFQSYYQLFDELTYELGLRIVALERPSKTGKTIRYIPSIKYFPDNLLNEEPRVDKLINEVSPLSLSKCYKHLAKELIYIIMKVSNLEEIIQTSK
ncbi:hypothetical protein [Aquimarina algicola]|uniref:Uncharacterized protein n=1 Tax=Aquimarina algicola TaxID=2589995 RepID=A0A504JLM9_9FLAO|nr:hypothetical protein [Aquimarina algicola]TPN87400.1 hypothetical protein FHK87_07390 [Aquimarina algicola]